MIVHNVLFPTKLDCWLQICENLYLCANDSSERPLSNRGIFMAVRVVRDEIFNFE